MLAYLVFLAHSLHWLNDRHRMQAANKHTDGFSDLDKQMLEIFSVHLGNSLSLARLKLSSM